MFNFRITCKCGRFITKDNDLFRISFYKLTKPTKDKTNKNEKIIEETFYYYVCPKCDSDVVVIKRKAINAAGNIKILIPEKLIGLEAIKYMQQTDKIRINKTSDLKYAESNIFVRGVPLSYFKTLSATTQRPRYINEASFSGDKVECKVKVYS